MTGKLYQKKDFFKEVWRLKLDLSRQKGEEITFLKDNIYLTNKKYGNNQFIDVRNSSLYYLSIYL